jgi:hypothetical protein
MPHQYKHTSTTIYVSPPNYFNKIGMLFVLIRLKRLFRVIFCPVFFQRLKLIISSRRPRPNACYKYRSASANSPVESLSGTQQQPILFDVIRTSLSGFIGAWSRCSARHVSVLVNREDFANSRTKLVIVGDVDKRVDTAMQADHDDSERVERVIEC